MKKKNISFQHMIDIIFTYFVLHIICIILTNAFDRLLTQKIETKLQQRIYEGTMKNKIKLKGEKIIIVKVRTIIHHGKKL